MRKNKLIPAVIVIVAVAAALLWFAAGRKKKDTQLVIEIKPVIAAIENSFSTTGEVLPRNRLEVKPPVSGRIDELLVKEGETVKSGQILVWMSSTERAALLDAARGQGDEKLAYWKEVYKGIPLMSPIDGEVIVATTQPGQTVTTADAVLVLSDRLIVRAQVDETDIGKVKLGQTSEIELDAYPDAKINAVVEHIYYESTTVNNVTIYQVDLVPESVPDFFRSGMNATVYFITARRDNALTIPQEAVIQEKAGAFVLVKTNAGAEPVQRQVTLGILDDKNVEVVAGLNPDDTVVIRSKKFVLPSSNTSTNPFLPQRTRPGQQQQQQRQSR
ncbi:MAG: efflux RND transporter periplasmic adaptor subunit [Candidatus Omnitrophica bacterium]|nr:efflux RND transporter periplasmic adaptor subunit [Candidatus Omnitrophota bacterium]